MPEPENTNPMATTKFIEGVDCPPIPGELTSSLHNYTIKLQRAIKSLGLQRLTHPPTSGFYLRWTRYVETIIKQLRNPYMENGQTREEYADSLEGVLGDINLFDDLFLLQGNISEKQRDECTEQIAKPLTTLIQEYLDCVWGWAYTNPKAQGSMHNADGGKVIQAPATSNSKPHYDMELRQLTYNGEVVKRFKQPAKNQATILEVFQEEGWPRRIDDPLKPGKLNQTIKDLNARQNHLRFLGDGDKGIIWEPAKPHPSSPKIFP